MFANCSIRLGYLKFRSYIYPIEINKKVMTQEEKEKLRGELVNEAIFLSDIQDQLWRYHPDNPQKVDVVWEYEQCQAQMVKIENKIKELE